MFLSHNNRNLLSYLLYRDSGDPVYYSINRLYDLTSITISNLYKLIGELQESGLPLRSVNLVTDDYTLDDISSQDHFVGTVLGIDSNLSATTSRRTLVALDMDTAFRIDLPLLPGTVAEPRLDTLDLGTCSIDDDQLVDTLRFLYNEKTYNLAKLLLSLRVGIQLPHETIQRDWLDKKEIRYMANLLEVDIPNFRIAHLRSSGLFDLDYHPSRPTRIGISYDSVRFNLTVDPVPTPSTEIIQDLTIATM